MKVQITKIDFNIPIDEFGDNDAQRAKMNIALQNVYVGQIWDCNDKDNLMEEITCASGYWVKSVDYRHVLK